MDQYTELTTICWPYQSKFSKVSTFQRKSNAEEKGSYFRFSCFSFEKTRMAVT